MVQLPFIPTTPRYRVSTQLEGSTYIFDVYWNTRDAAWFFDLLRDDETPIRLGCKVVLGALIGGRSVDANFPPGRFVASDLSGAGREAGLDDLGNRVTVYFYTDAELEA